MPTVLSIQFLRFIAAYLVVIQHSNLAISTKVAPTSSWFHYIAEGGVSGVHVFFVISGFIMVYTSSNRFGDKSYVLEFLRRRFIRIFPVYWVLALVNIVFFLHLDFGTSYSITDAIYAAVLYPGYSSDWIFVGWTLSYEIYFYLILAMLIPFTINSALKIMTAVFFGLVVLGIIFQPVTESLQVFTNTLLLEFLMGGWIAWLAIKGPLIPRYLAISAILFGVTGYVTSYIVGYGGLPSVVTWGLPSALLIFGFVELEKSGGLPKLVKKSSWLGDSSYSLYLVHAIIVFPFAAALPAVGVEVTSPILWVFILSLVCVIAGIISYKLIEKPAIRTARQILHAQRSAPARTE